MDGTDFQIPEHGRQCFSFKFRKSALRYEIGLSILDGEICWISGPYQPRVYKNLAFWTALAAHLNELERWKEEMAILVRHHYMWNVIYVLPFQRKGRKWWRRFRLVRKQSTGDSSNDNGRFWSKYFTMISGCIMMSCCNCCYFAVWNSRCEALLISSFFKNLVVW